MFPLIFHHYETYQSSFDINSSPTSTYVYKVVDGTFLDPETAISVALGTGGQAKIKDIDARTELVLASTLLSEIKTIHKSGKRCLIVFIVTDFPYIQMRIDTRDQTLSEKENGDQFFEDVYNLWSTYDIEKSVPIIITNTELPHTGLAIIDLFDNLCVHCGKSNAKSKCSKCKLVRYCCKECQIKDWPIHKKYHL